jgi:hypothetical protein
MGVCAGGAGVSTPAPPGLSPWSAPWQQRKAAASSTSKQL